MENTTLFHLPKYLGYHKKTEVIEWIALTIDELKNLRRGQHVSFVSPVMGDVRRCKVNGMPQTWKTRPNDVKVPLKYGLYEYSYAEMKNGLNVGTVLVKEH